MYLNIIQHSIDELTQKERKLVKFDFRHECVVFKKNDL